MRMRPDKAQLVHQHILEDTNMEPMVSATHQRLKRARIEQDLDCKIKNRPGPLELIEGNILKAEHFVEQAVKDGKVKFLKTNEMDTCDDSPYNFDEDSQEGGSDEPMSPPQLYSQQSDNPPSSVGSIPSPPDFTSYYDHHMIPPSITSSSPIQIRIPSTTPTTMSMITIKQEPGVTSPPPIVSMPNTVTSSSPSSSKSGSSSSSSSKNSRKKQTKRNKPKEIKFHEYKPPNEQANKLAIPPNASNPYNLLLMQQQLLLQLQLLQQQHHQLILPNAPNMSTTTSSKLSSNSNQGSQSPSSTTVTSSSSPTPQDNKANVANCTKTRILSNLEDMKVSELKMELKNRGLHVSGTKPQLVERLRPYADVSMSPVATANSSNQDVTSSSICSGTSGTKVTSSTDAGQEVASETGSARASMSSPPVSPPDFKSPVSVATSEMSDPASPGSAFDPMSPSTFQMAPPPSVTTNPGSVVSASSPPSVFSPSSESMHKQQVQTNVQMLNSFQNQTFQMELNDSNSVMEQVMDMSAQLAYNDPAVSSDILRKQQQKIEELQRALRLSQLQLRQHQTNLQSPILSPPPAPPPPPAHTAAPSGATGVSPKTGSPIKLASINPHPPPPPISMPSINNPPATTISTAIKPPPPPITAVHIKSQSPPKQSSPPVFQPPDFATSLNQQQRTFTFTTPSPNGQPFLFSKTTQEVKPGALSNGLLPGQKSSSLPSSPTDPEAVLGISSGASLPAYNSPPPNYEEAVRQTKERKAHLGSLLNPINTETGEPRMTKSQDLDDLLEVLVDHGYQIPVTPKNKDVINLSHTRLQTHVSLPSFSMATTSSSPRFSQAGVLNSTSTSQQGIPQSQMPHPPPPPPPHPQQQQQQQSQEQQQQQPRQQVKQQQQHNHPVAAAPIAIPHSSSAPSPSPMELPMDVDTADMTLNALDVGTSQPSVSKEQHLMSSATMDDKDNANILSFDIPSMQVDGDRDGSTFWAFGDHPSPSAGMLCPPSSSDSDMNWLDVMMSSSGSGLTPVSVTPPTNIGAEGSLGTPLGKEPFSLNLFDLNDDAWDNIHVTD
ncbi:myocardin-related transcription factor A-like [Lytechinus pictus]|uniref:myocardin-related transcription factor A-like n=1 Tax=Lytechinus pictus TaxID=7653 RepID=UPI0030B9C332